MQLNDGTGSGKKAKVNDYNQLETSTVFTSELAEVSVRDGQAFAFHTDGFIDITTINTETGIIHFVNNSNSDLYMHSLRTCGTQVQKIKVYKNATTGTLISAATVAGKGNLNFTSTNTPSVTVYKGADLATLTDGTLIGQHINGIGHSNEPFDGALILGKGDSLSITFELAIAGSVCVRAVGFRKD